MKIEYVNHVNLNLLEDAYNSGILNARDFTKDFGCNMPVLLSHLKLSFIVSEISILEAYMLKRFCGGELIDLETSMDDNKIDNCKYPVTHRSMQSIFLLNKSINNDDDVGVKPGVMLFPIKCVEKKCMITFQGHSVLSIIGMITRHSESFFNKVTKNMNAYPNKSKDEIIDNLLIDGLIKEFYSFMVSKIKAFDLLTDSTLDYLYLQYAKNNSNNLTSLSHVNSIYGTIPFININTDEYSKSIDTIRKNKISIGSNKNDISMNTTELFFVCNTSFYTFMELFLYLPIGSILESTDIKILYTSNEYIIPQEMSKYQTRITSIIEKMRDERMLNANENSVDNYNLIPLNTKIQYTVKFKLSEISNILMTLENKIVNDNIYGDENNYLAREILKVVSLMKKYAIAVYSSIIK